MGFAAKERAVWPVGELPLLVAKLELSWIPLHDSQGAHSQARVSSSLNRLPGLWLWFQKVWPS